MAINLKIHEAVELCYQTAIQKRVDAMDLYSHYIKAYMQEKEIQGSRYPYNMDDLMFESPFLLEKLLERRHQVGMVSLKKRIEEIENQKAKQGLKLQEK